MRRLLILVVAVLVALLPATALADSHEKGGLTVRISGDYVLPAGEELEVLVVIDGNAEIAGTIHDALIVVNGEATVSGTVDGSTTIVRGDLTLTDSAVAHDIQLIRSDLDRAPGATVRGDIDESEGWWVGWWIFFGIILLVGLGLLLFVVAIGFALIGGKQLNEAAASLTAKPWQTVVAGVVTVIALPVLAVLAMATIVGIWVGLSVLLILIPVLAILGIVVAATWLGSLILHRDGHWPVRPVGAAALGMAIMLVAFAIPGLGVLAFIVFGTWGLGGLVCLAVRGFGGGKASPAAAPAPPPAAEAPGP